MLYLLARKVLDARLSLPSEDPWQIGVNIAQVLATIAAFVAWANALALLWSWWRRSTKPPPAPTSVDIDKAKDVLAGSVTEKWGDETVLRLLGHPEPIPVPWRSTEHKELMDHPRLIAKGALSFPSLSDHMANMANDFRALRCRRLVIIGGPGTGKTTLAVQLLMELLKTRLPGEPVPVLLSAARWDTETHPQLHDWLAECLSSDYPALHAEGFGPDTARTLATRSEVLPILDGLDELPAEARAGILTALNRSMCDDDQLILTCRTTEFAESVDAVGALAAAAVIESSPLSAEAVADYLQACLPPRPHHTWPRVLDALREGATPALAWVAATPLKLWLVRAAYITPQQDPSPLLDLGQGDPSTLNDHLHDQLIPALVNSRLPTDDPAQPFRPRHAWNPEHVRQWLTYLSQLLDRDSRDVAWWRLARHTPTRSVRLAVSLSCGLVVAITIGFLTNAVASACASVIAGAGAGVIYALLIMIITRSWFTELPGYAVFRLHGRLSLLVHLLIPGLIIALLTALVGLLLAISEAGAARAAGAAVMLVLACEIVFVAIFGMTKWVEYPTDTATARSPRSTWQADRKLTLFRVLCGLMIGLVVGGIALKAVLSAHLALVAPLALVGGLLLGLLFGLRFGSHHAWLAYNLTVPRLATEGRLPLRAMCFLDDAHRLGLLRTEGPFYQFRNLELQKHLSRQCRVESGSGERRQTTPQPPQ
ncbi:NACHT domain-containing protein [Microtetraspora sp. NBRC 16547]|nr:NACHT domain-containing protein [Microtetraspora sp. NBRC 16547]